MATSSSVLNKLHQLFTLRRLSCLFLLFTLFLIVIAPLFLQQEVDGVDLYSMREGPSLDHWLGTDAAGRDVLIRLCYGGRISLFVALCTMAIQVFIGSVIGGFMGYVGGWLDRGFSYFVNVVMCFPFFILAFAMTSVWGSGLLKLILIISLLSWPRTARVIRSEVMVLRGNDYILSARALGLNQAEIIATHIFPNILPHIVVAATLATAGAILLEAALSFLGLGVPPPMSSWGNMLTAAQSMTVLKYEWWTWLPPGIMLICSVLSINCMGDGLRQLLDTKGKYV